MKSTKRVQFIAFTCFQGDLKVKNISIKEEVSAMAVSFYKSEHIYNNYGGESKFNRLTYLRGHNEEDIKLK